MQLIAVNQKGKAPPGVFLTNSQFKKITNGIDALVKLILLPPVLLPLAVG